jgi:hypothetical protein
MNTCPQDLGKTAFDSYPFPKDFCPINKRSFVDNESAALATEKVFRLVKALGGQWGEASEISAAPLPKQSVGIVFDNGNASTTCNAQDVFHFGADASIVNDNNPLGSPPCSVMGMTTEAPASGGWKS